MELSYMSRSKFLIGGLFIGSVAGCSQHYIASFEQSDLLHETFLATTENSFSSKNPWKDKTDHSIERCDEHDLSTVVKEVESSVTDAGKEREAPSSLWQRMRQGFALLDYDHPAVEKNIEWFRNRPLHMQRLAKQAEPYLYYIVDEVEKRNMPLEIALLPAIESAYKPHAHSRLAAAGLWQFMPATARYRGLQMDWWYDERRDVKGSTKAALDYLQELYKTFDNDWLLALAAYNAGQGNVRKALRKNRQEGKGLDFWELNLPKETKNYVPKLLALSKIVLNPDQYGIKLIDIENSHFFAEVEVDSQIDLALVANLSETPIEQIRRLNPAFKRWATSPDGAYGLLLPVDKVETFKQKIAEIPKEQHVRWAQHKIRFGETLSHIAKKYRMSVALLRQVNGLKSSKIRAGKLLMVPVLSQGEDGIDEPRKVVHIVSRGDTLWDLAKAYNVSVNKIAAWNRLSEKSILNLGQRVVVWVKPDRA